jgi:hypothetical protein
MRRPADDTILDHLLYLLMYKEGFYIGVTNNLKRRLREHGYKRKCQPRQVIILMDNLTEKDAYDLEEVIVDKECIDNPWCLNETIGGRYPDNKRLGRPHTEESKQKMSKWRLDRAAKGMLWQQQPENRKILCALAKRGDENPSRRPEIRKLLSEQKIGAGNPSYGKPGTMLGKKASTETKRKQLEQIAYRIQTPDGIFMGAEEAGKYYGISAPSILRRCHNPRNNPKWIGWEVLGRGLDLKHISNISGLSTNKIDNIGNKTKA